VKRNRSRLRYWLNLTAMTALSLTLALFIIVIYAGNRWMQPIFIRHRTTRLDNYGIYRPSVCITVKQPMGFVISLATQML
jgi:hypothetical protein